MFQLYSCPNPILFKYQTGSGFLEYPLNLNLYIVDVYFIPGKVLGSGEPVNTLFQAVFQGILRCESGQIMDFGVIAAQAEHFGIFRAQTVLFRDECHIGLHQLLDQIQGIPHWAPSRKPSIFPKYSPSILQVFTTKDTKNTKNTKNMKGLENPSFVALRALRG